MAHFRTTVESAASPAVAHALVADFSNITDWDPGVVSAERLDSGPLGSAVTYDALLELNGLRKVLDPALNVTFQLVGRRAEAGMRRALAPDMLDAPLRRKFQPLAPFGPILPMDDTYTALNDG